MTGRFSEEAWQRTAALRAAIGRLPFNTELAAGTSRRSVSASTSAGRDLSRRVCPRAGDRRRQGARRRDGALVFARRPARRSRSSRHCTRAISPSSGSTPEAVAAAEPSPDCLAYTSYLLATAHQQPWEVTGRGDPAVLLDLLGRGRRDRRRARRRTTRTAPGSTPMPTRVSARPCARPSTSPTAPPRPRRRRCATRCSPPSPARRSTNTCSGTAPISGAAGRSSSDRRRSALPPLPPPQPSPQAGEGVVG